MSEIHAITVEKILPYPPDKIWRALTSSDVIATWLMPNDFAAVVGHRFNFRARPMGTWDGVVYCEVLACEPPRLLCYSWTGGSDSDPERGSRIDTTVTWTLTPIDGGTHLKMVHDGFKLPDDRFAYEAMSPGWSRIAERIGSVVAELA